MVSLLVVVMMLLVLVMVPLVVAPRIELARAPSHPTLLPAMLRPRWSACVDAYFATLALARVEAIVVAMATILEMATTMLTIIP